MRHATVVVRENRRREITIEYKGKLLAYTMVRPSKRQAEIVSSKKISMKLDELTFASTQRNPYIPPPDHPWRRVKINAKTMNFDLPR